MIKKENLWIIVLWVLVFLLVLAWDQEKIVVINLVVFCYFIYFLAGDSIEATVMQRQMSLVEALSSGLNSRIKILRSLLLEVRTNFELYENIILSILNRFKAVLTSISLGLALACSKEEVFDSLLLQILLNTYFEQCTNSMFNQNMYIVNQVSGDVNTNILREVEELEVTNTY